MAAKRKTGTHPGAPTSVTVSGGGKKKPRKKRSGGKRHRAAPAAGGSTAGSLASVTAGIRSRIQKLIGSGPLSQRLGQAVQVGVFGLEVGGVGAAVSALSGYREAQGKSLKIPYTPIDARVAAGVVGLGIACWKPTAINPHALAISTGLLSSWGHENMFEVGARFGRPAVTEAAAGVPDAAVVLGNVEDQSGLFGIALTKKAKEKKEQRKLGHLEHREQKIEHKIEKVKQKLGTPTAAAAPASSARSHGGRALPKSGPNVVYVQRGVQIRGPRGHVLPAFASRHPQKAAWIRAGARVVHV